MYSISVKNLTKIFNKQIVIKKITFNVQPNSIVGILGKNGAGKTTLLGMLMGLITPTDGSVFIFGKDLKKKKNEILNDINFQSPYVELPKKMSVEQNLFFYSRLYSLKNIKKIVYELAEKLRIHNLLKKSYGELSAGQKTKVNLCKALLNKPKLLLLDEPTASLDPETSIFIRNFLMEFKKENKSSILITSHNLDEIKNMCSELILLKSGEIVNKGNIHKLLKENNSGSIMDFFLKRG